MPKNNQNRLQTRFWELKNFSCNIDFFDLYAPPIVGRIASWLKSGGLGPMKKWQILAMYLGAKADLLRFLEIELC